MDITTNSIKEQLTTLAELQRNEIDIAAIEKDLSGVQVQIDALEDQLKAFQQQLEESRGQLKELKGQYRSDESEVKKIEDGIAKSEVKLRSVKTNKEYQSILKEIDDLKSKGSAIEDQMLVMLEQIEAADIKTNSLLADETDLKSEIEEQKIEIYGKMEEQKLKLTRLQQERNAIWSDLPSKLQVIYDKAKQQGRGIGVAAVIDAVCQVCRMNVPPQQFIELMRLDKIRLCPNCQRIIYPNTIWD